MFAFAFAYWRNFFLHKHTGLIILGLKPPSFLSFSAWPLMQRVFFCFALHTHGLFGFATTFTLLYFTASSQKKQQQQQQHTPPTPTQTTTTTATIIAATERFVRSSSCCEYIF